MPSNTVAGGRRLKGKKKTKKHVPNDGLTGYHRLFAVTVKEAIRQEDWLFLKTRALDRFALICGVNLVVCEAIRKRIKTRKKYPL